MKGRGKDRTANRKDNKVDFEGAEYLADKELDRFIVPQSSREEHKCYKEKAENERVVLRLWLWLSGRLRV